ncbi:MAG: 4-hydroxy-tetrahydrodipicolinate synthase [Gammaproteobacteria bacterium]|nr:4-hydroxy-tetrahydrodipicolinate synthase [Gammaproteobacteria bacterium]
MTALFTGSIVALVTPMTAAGQIDTAAYERLLQWHLAAGSDGLVIGGTTGESATLRPAELEGLLKLAVQAVAGRIPVIAGTGTNSTAGSAELTTMACAAGADACLVVTPSYNKPTQEGLYFHYQAIADAASAPVILYNVPGRTGTDLLAATVARLSAHERIVAIKEATADIERTREIIRLCGDDMTVISGDDATALAAMHAGARGVVSVSANIVPDKMAALCRAALAGDFEQGRDIDENLRELHQALFIESNPIPVKYILARMGYIEPALRLPLTPLQQQNEAKVTDAVKRAGVKIT